MLNSKRRSFGLRLLSVTTVVAGLVSACAQPVDAQPDVTASSDESGGTSSVDSTPAVPTDAGRLSDADVPLFDQCAAVAVEANLIPANFLFLLDSSGSMNCVPPDGNAEEAALCKTDPRKRGDGPSKWEVTQRTLTAALQPLLDRDSLSVAVGVFPQVGTQCGVSDSPDLSFDPLTPNQLESTTALLQSISPDGATPIAGAAILSYAHLSNLLRSRKLVGNTFLVMLTDGNETCKPSELDKLLNHDAPLALDGFGIRTFVIGAPGSEDARALLSQLAFAGGTASRPDCDHSEDSSSADCHFDMTRSTDFQADLAAALDDITQTKALTCEFDVPSNPDGEGVNRGQVNVTVVKPGSDGEQLQALGRHEGPIGSCDGKVDGWTYSLDLERILVCGADCDRIEKTPEAQVRIVLGCPSLDRQVVK